MKPSSSECQSSDAEVGVYDCEIHLKFRLIEEKGVLCDRDQLLDLLLDAFSCGADECLETIVSHADAREISEVETSPQMRRHLIRLRNSKSLA